MNCQTFSCGFSAGHLGGSGTMVMLAGTRSLAETCHPAWSSNSAAWRPGVTFSEMAAKGSTMPSVLHQGSTRAAPVPSRAQMAPKM